MDERDTRHGSFIQWNKLLKMLQYLFFYKNECLSKDSIQNQKMYKIGFIGLSGVGKSSIINTLTEKPLAPCGPDNPTLKRAEYPVKKITYVYFP